MLEPAFALGKQVRVQMDSYVRFVNRSTRHRKTCSMSMAS
jgi:hypothetical protein